MPFDADPKDDLAMPLCRQLAEIRCSCAVLAVLDARAADVIIGYDERGLPS